MTTRAEIRDLLLTRVGWFNEPSFPISISDANQETAGRYFQDEHEIVDLENIVNIIKTVDPDEEQFNIELDRLRKRVVMHVVDETFADMNIPDLDLTDCENLFDAAISQRMAMKVGELILTTKRKNFVQRNGKDFVKYVYVELNGNSNFPDKIGISSKYNKELTRLRDLFNTDDMLDTITVHNNDDAYLDQYRFEAR